MAGVFHITVVLYVTITVTVFGNICYLFVVLNVTVPVTASSPYEQLIHNVHHDPRWAHEVFNTHLVNWNSKSFKQLKCPFSNRFPWDVASVCIAFPATSEVVIFPKSSLQFINSPKVSTLPFMTFAKYLDINYS